MASPHYRQDPSFRLPLDQHGYSGNTGVLQSVDYELPVNYTPEGPCSLGIIMAPYNTESNYVPFPFTIDPSTGELDTHEAGAEYYLYYGRGIRTSTTDYGQQGQIDLTLGAITVT